MPPLLDRFKALFTGTESPLVLYSMEYCYYCQRVQRAAKKLGVKVETRDIYHDVEARERLHQATGRTRVPVLGIMGSDGKEQFLPESEEIIAFLRSYAEQEEDGPRAG